VVDRALALGTDLLDQFTGGVVLVEGWVSGVPSPKLSRIQS